MTYEVVKRNRYYDPGPPIQTSNHASINHYQDLQDFHIPLEHMHNSCLHDWGIARGLEVNGTIGGTEIIINSGVAIDSDGQLISLSSSGFGANDPTSPTDSTKVVSVPVHIGTESQAGQTVYVTIQFSEILRANEGALGRMEQVPWVRLQPVAAYVNDGTSIILAIAVIDAAGNLAELKPVDSTLPYRRRLIGEAIEELRIQRSSKVVDSVQEILSGKIGPGDGGGLRITVPDAEDSILFAKEGGSDFAKLEVRANVGIGMSGPGTRLEVDGPYVAGKGTAYIKGVGDHGYLAVDTDTPITKESGILWEKGGSIKWKGYVPLNSNDLRFYDTADRVTIQAGGNVGIGTTNPQQNLSVNGAMNLDQANANNGTVSSALTFGSGSGEAIASNRTADGNPFGLDFYTAFVNRMSITQGGNVGIGTTDPTAQLSIVGSGLGLSVEAGFGLFVSAQNSGSGGVYGIYAVAGGSGTGPKYAGIFVGDVFVAGTLSKTSGGFLIDHPLDPYNKTLRHSFVESPEDLCLYRGKVQLDIKGRATVKMPEYFPILAKEEEATVTLTPTGKKPFPLSYEWNSKFTAFTIFGEPSAEATYIVLADRDDPSIQHLRRPVEEEKGDGHFKKGKLLFPEAHGQSREIEAFPLFEEQRQTMEKLREI